MKKEFIIWGIPPNHESETILVSEKANIKTMRQAKEAVELLASKHGCKACRVQVIDFSEPLAWDSRAMVNV
jgi:hypothetical protein